MAATATSESRLERMEREFAEYKDAQEKRAVADRREIERLKQKDSIDVVIKRTPVSREKVRAWLDKTPEVGVVFAVNAVKHMDRDVVLIAQKRIELGNGVYRECQPLRMLFREMPEGVLTDLPYSVLVGSIWDLNDMSFTQEDLNQYPEFTKGMRPKTGGDYKFPEVLTAFREVFGHKLSRMVTNPQDPWPEFMDGVKVREWATLRYKALWDDQDNKKAQIDARQSGNLYALKSGNLSTPIAETQFAGV